MKVKMTQFSAMNPNPVLSVGEDGVVLYSNIAGEPLLQKWGVGVGDKLPSDIVDSVQRVISENSLEKMEVKVGKSVYLVVFHPLPEEEFVNIYGFDISDQKELEEKLRIKEKQSDVLHKIGKIAFENESLQTFMDESVKLIACILELEYCKIMELLPDGKLLLRAGIGWKSKFVGKNIVEGREGSQAGYTLFSGIPVIVEDFEKENRFEKPKILKIHGVASGASVIIGSGEKVFGVLVVNSTKKRKFMPDDTYFLSSVVFLIAQVIERKKAEEALKESEEKYRNIVETTNEGVWVFNSVFETTYVNEKMAEMLGYNREEMTGSYLWDYADEEDEGFFQTKLANRKQGIDEVYECRLLQKTGSDVWLLVSAKALFDKDGKYAGSLGMFTDITERKKAEEALRLSNIYNRSLIEASLDPLVTIGRDGKITDVNGATEKVTGYSRKDMIGTVFSDYFTEPEKARKGYEQVFIDGKVYDYSLKIQHRDEHITPVLYNASVYRDEKGEVIGVFAAARDITELEKAKEKIQRLANAVESSDDAIITMSLDGIIASWNKGAEKVYGHLAEEVLGKNISVLEPDNLKGEIKQLIEKIKQGERIQHYETLRLKKDGTIINVSLTHSPVFNVSGELADISIIARDITDKKIAEKLFQEKQMAEVANRTKNEFLANISHELRTPLNSIIGFSDMLYEQMHGQLNQKQLRYVDNVSKSGKHLLNLINNILDISKIEAGKMELVYKNFELVTKLNMVRNILFPIADQKNIKIEIDMDSRLGIICADEEKFVQIMYNLVDNAIKFSYQNSVIKIGARKKGNMVEITVKDTGIGIKFEDQYKLFKPFSQIDSFSSRKFQGTGLGLSLVKQIVHMHKGYVWFRSNSGEGSMFAFVIPVNNNKEYSDILSASSVNNPDLILKTG